MEEIDGDRVETTFGTFLKMAMSLPAQKAPGPPANITQRTESRSSDSRKARVISTYIGCVSAFFFSGRFIRIIRTPSSSVTRTSSGMAPLLFELECRRFGQARGFI